jgi:hypothetical protein
LSKEEVISFVCDKIKKNNLKVLKGPETYEGYLRTINDRFRIELTQMQPTSVEEA